MVKYEENLTALLDNGVLQPVSGASVAVTDVATGLPATLFKDDGVTPITLLTTDNTGYFAFRAANGAYKLTFSGAHIVTFTRQVTIFDPASDDVVLAKDYGAKGDGSTDDTAAFVAALASGKSVLATSGVYKLTAGLTMQARGQRLIGQGALLKPYGNFDVITLTGGFSFMGVSGIYVFGDNLTGGWSIKVANADRVDLDDLMITSPFNGIYVEKSNVCRVRNAWLNGARGTNCIKWYGDAGKRSDILQLSAVNLSGDSVARPVGIEWDGNCNTLQGVGVTTVNCSRGLYIRNTAGAGAPAFGMFHDFECDFPSLSAVEIEAGSYFHFTSPYLHGSTAGSGLTVAAAVLAGTVTISGGKVTSHARYGIESSGDVLGTNLAMSGNTLGNYSGTVKTTSPRFEMDGTGYLQTLTGGSPTLNFDSNDYMSYSRAGNVVSFTIGGATAFTVSGTLIDAKSPIRLPSYTVATLPDAVAYARSTIYVSDGTTNKRLAISDGTNWRWPDGAIVS